MTWLLDLIHGPPDYCVILEDGFYFAVLYETVDETETEVLIKGLRRGEALTMARRLRQVAEDRPEWVS